MTQKNIRKHNGQEYSVKEAVAWLEELDNRTKSSKPLNSIEELASNVIIQGEGISVLRPKAIKSFSSRTVTGAIKILLPHGFTNTMMKLRIEVFDYNKNKSFTAIVSGYAYKNSNTWVDTSVTVLGRNDVSVRFGYDSGKCCIYLGNIDSVFNYPRVWVDSLMVSFNNTNPENWINGWQIKIETSQFQNITSIH